MWGPMRSYVIVRDWLGVDVLADGVVPVVHQVVVGVVVPGQHHTSVSGLALPVYNSLPARTEVVWRREGRHVGGVQASQTYSAGLLRKCLLAFHHLPVNLVEMYLTDLVHDILVVESNKAKASVSVRDFVVSQHWLFNLRTAGLD